ncbi:GNAT family N-acetyltransferase [Bartonella apis]|uniref:GNAT family N-acetyltransferase n=1 Tax=Bartonella apis TaxID=1686310 RepID=UPI0009605622|nr:GNAT family N-acetyltransferase [Bartonella apis]MCT6824255.1 GNAT family N-acetyltransferase [Bartonella apis]MCT6861735.1 GNAT family N-acetyltransferase [Bartonella apis]MCT6886281.1 GNAT family N-acetyltransferase [Bartonella apis]OLY47764.1 Ribosomal protein S18 acetylase RimI [Bartonella apis]
MWIRTASRNDINAIHDLLVETWHATLDDLVGREEVDRKIAHDYTTDMLKKMLSRPASEYVVADDGDMLHGVAYAAQGAVKGDSEIALVLHLCVKPESRGQGIGQRLLIELEEAFPAARKIRVVLNKKDVRTQKFFEEQGYKHLGKSGDNKSGDDVVLEKTLF